MVIQDGRWLCRDFGAFRDSILSGNEVETRLNFGVNSGALGGEEGDFVTLDTLDL